MDENIIADENKHEAAQHEQQQQQQHSSKQQQQHKPSSSSSGLAAFPKRTRVCDAEDDETALTPPPAAKIVKLNDPEGRSGAEAEAGGQVDDGRGIEEAASRAASERGSTADNAVPGQGQASQQAATLNASTTTGWQAQAGAWLTRAAAKKTTVPGGTQPHHTLNNDSSANGSLLSSPPVTSHNLRMSQSYVLPSIYTSGIYWHLIVPPGPPPSEAGDIQAFEVVRIPALSGGLSPFNGRPSTRDPPLAHVDPAGSPIVIVAGYVQYSFDEPLVRDPLSGEERFKVYVHRTLTRQGKQLLLRELAQPQVSVRPASMTSTQQQQQPCPSQALPLQLPVTSSFPDLRATVSTPALHGPAHFLGGPSATGASTSNLAPNGALITEISSSTAGALASPPRSAGSAAQGAPPGPSASIASSASTGASASAVAAVAGQGNEQVTAPAIGNQQAATSTAGVQEADEAVASAQTSPAAASKRLPSMWRPVSWTPEPITDPELLAKLKERMKRTEGRGPGWSPTPSPEPESPKGEESSCTSGHKAGHDQESAKSSHEGGGMMANRNGEDGDRDGGGAS